METLEEMVNQMEIERAKDILHRQELEQELNLLRETATVYLFDYMNGDRCSCVENSECLYCKSADVLSKIDAIEKELGGKS